MSTLRDKWNSRNAEWLERHHAPENEKARRADFDRRLRAAGIEDEPEYDADIEAFRDGLTRRLYMYINDWHGCPEGQCRRQRGCMAPNTTCANAEPLPPDPDDVAWDKARFETRAALNEMLAERAAEVEAYEDEIIRRREAAKAAKAGGARRRG